MKIAIEQTVIALWRYSCPECGISDAESGYQAPHHMLYCEVCLEEGRQVKLRRWPADHDSSPAPRGRLRG